MVTAATVRHSAEVKLVLNVTGAPEQCVNYSKRKFAPARVYMTFTYTPSADESGFFWRLSFVDLKGHRILKPGPDGEQRFGSQVCSWGEWGHGQQSAEDRDGFPEWLADVVRRVRPKGEVGLPTL